MKKCCAWILVLCMLFSVAVAEMQIGTEQMLAQIVEAIMNNGTFWLDYADEQTQLTGGVTLDEDGMPGVGVRFQNGGKDVYAAVNAQGIRASNGEEVISTTWEEAAGATGAMTASPQLTQEDAELLGVVLGEIVQPVLQTVRMNVSSVQLDGQPAQCTEFVAPLKEACAALDQSVPAALNAHADELNELISRNQAFLRSLGVRAYSVQSMVYDWWELKVVDLCPEDVNVVVRWTESADAWKLEVSVMNMGLEVHFDGQYVDGRIYAFGQEWTFDSRDLEMLLRWMQELFLQLSPDAFDFSFTQSFDETRLHLQADAEKLLSQLSSGVNNVLSRHADQAQAIIDRYAPFFGMNAHVTVDEIIGQLQQSLSSLLTEWRMRSRDALGTVSSALEVDFYTVGESVSLRVKSPRLNADVSFDDYGMDVVAAIMIDRSSYEVTVHGLQNADSLQLNGTMGRDGNVQTRWTLSGVMENGARVFSLTVNDNWLGTATMREGSVEVTTAAGWQGSVMWSRRGVSLHSTYGEEVTDASVRWGDGQLTAQASTSALNTSLLIREENGGGRVRFQHEKLRGENDINLFVLEGAVTDEQFMFKAGNTLKSAYEEATIWEVGVDIRENRASGTLVTRDTKASFQWSPGMFSAKSLYGMRSLTVDTSLLVSDVTTPGTGDVNTTQIKWEQLLHYNDETVENSRLYTVHTTADENTLHISVVGEEGECIKADLMILQEPADLFELLGLDETQTESAGVVEPVVEAEPQPTAKPVGGAFLTKP